MNHMSPKKLNVHGSKTEFVLCFGLWRIGP